ncbi:hypothetical protein EVJ33_12895 [Exiguobacterium sp. SL-10]|uniref:hypothetical protein n=1 Tax=unclassified Exiguobacterium TaxID=2644629 RepID=UPI00103BE6DD|nr:MULTISPECIES: hypothetical protein [unclassified Exiguobacterium]TCI20795.1 hypothetical protein EVJ34_13165 [Exiguobacterium sp. SL-9]TCI28630.1 hypothetical protein EVJ33_12895 [Exiguobacterium sp. SL-10]
MLFYFLTTILSVVGLSVSLQTGFFKDPIGTFLFAVLLAMGLSSFKQLVAQTNVLLIERRNEKKIKRIVARMHSSTRKRST